MSALARYLNTAGVKVRGYDKTPTPLTSELEREGIEVHYDDMPELVGEGIDLIVYTPAIPNDLGEFQKALNSGIRMLKRSEFLEEITKDHDTFAVAGTHGKTTVSTMLAHILFSSSRGCTAFLGGIAKNYNSNLLLNHNSKNMVAEADEFDRSFLRLHPKLAVITSTDADHLDIYHDHESLLSSFSQFAGNVVPGGKILIKEGIDLPLPAKSDVNVYTYSINAIADFYIAELELVSGKYKFTLHTPDGTLKGFNPTLPGLFNVENSVAAASAAWLAGVEGTDIVRAVNSFMGVRRRFDHRVEKEDLLYIDDYAHHPEELKACITSVRKLYPGRHITGIFQPHLYTRTRDFAAGFAESLSLLDNLILLDIYPAREKPIKGITSEMLLELTPIENKILLKKDDVGEYLKRHRPDILLTLGAGDIDQLVPVIEKIFN